jgi:hypothetical protein
VVCIVFLSVRPPAVCRGPWGLVVAVVFFLGVGDVAGNVFKLSHGVGGGDCCQVVVFVFGCGDCGFNVFCEHLEAGLCRFQVFECQCVVCDYGAHGLAFRVGGVSAGWLILRILPVLGVCVKPVGVFFQTFFSGFLGVAAGWIFGDLFT